MASAAASSDLARHILPSHLQSLPLPYTDEAVALWSQGHVQTPPAGSAAFQQKSWDTHKVLASADSLLNGAPDATSRARLLAVSIKESGAWLNALPIPSLGLRLDDNILRVAVGLRLGSPLCRPHTCHHCGAEVDCLAIQGLSCRWSQGRHHRHAAINDIIHLALSSAKIPSRLEPSGLYRSYGKRPDGISVVPWRRGKLLVWDATCPDTFAPSYILCFGHDRSRGRGCQGRSGQVSIYSHLDPNHLFEPVAIETSGAFGPSTRVFLEEFGGCL